MANEIQIVNDYSVGVRGVFGRNRTEKFHTIRLLRLLSDGPQPTHDEVVALAKREIENLRLKTGRWVLRVRRVEVETYPDGVKIEKTMMFQDETTLHVGSR